MLNKSFLTNFVSLLLIAAGFLTDGQLANILYNTGVFAFSGAITNWLAIYMLFEKVPGLYGSGVIPARFEDFKRGIHALLMEQFFTKENVERFFSEADGKHRDNFDITPIIESVDFNPAFEGLVQVIMTSSFGGMLAMFGGEPALQPLRIPFCEKMKISLEEISKTETFQQNLQANISQSSATDEVHRKVEVIVNGRLDELTPKLVKEIIQRMIQEHLGWLVVWGGIFGGLIGLAASQFPQ